MLRALCVSVSVSAQAKKEEPQGPAASRPVGCHAPSSTRWRWGFYGQEALGLRLLTAAPVLVRKVANTTSWRCPTPMNTPPAQPTAHSQTPYRMPLTDP